jgi:DNA repair protein REV1
MLARLASRKAKPAGSYHLIPEDVSTFMSSLDINALHGFGNAAHQKAQEKLGTTSLQELAKKSKAVLCDALGKGTGEILYKAIRGIDDKALESDKPRRSVSCDINVSVTLVSNTHY